MKYIYLLLILIYSAAVLSAAPLNTLVVNNGNWKTAASWSLGRIPAGGDSVLIPSGFTVKVTSFLDYSPSTFKIGVYGALFVTQSGTFKIGVNSVIKVYAGGIIKADLSDNDPTQGTIRIGTVVKFSDGDGMNITGPSFASSATGADPSGFSSFSILPVVFMNFTAIRNSDNSVELAWTTAEENNNKNYLVEKSTNSADWNEIATILPGNNQQINSYNYKDINTTAALTYYRIKQVDMDGKYIYSDMKVIKGGASNNSTTIFSANKNITVRLARDVQNKVEVRLISMSGTVLEQQSFENASASMTLSAGNILSGIYVVQVVSNNGLIAAKKIVLN